MKCKVCNSDLYEGQAFCSYCGAKVETVDPASPPTEQVAERPEPETSSEERTPNNSDDADTMAKTGMILGIVSLAANFTCCLSNTVPCILGIIFSVKGLKSAKNKNMALAGLIMSCVAAAMSLITPIFSFQFSGYDFEIPDFMEDFDLDIASLIHLPLFK